MTTTSKRIVLALAAATALSVPAQAANLKIALSPYGDAAAKKAEVVDFIMLVIRTVEPGERADFLHGITGGSICSFAVPDSNAYTSEKAKLNANKECAATLMRFANEASDTRAAGTLNLPHVLRTIIQTSDMDGVDALIFSGSPIHDDPREPSTSMAQGDTPSDGHSVVSQGLSPYGMAGLKGGLKSTPVHLTAEGIDWARNSNHAFLVNRFWGVTMDFLDGPLVTFNQDRKKVAEQLKSGVTTPAQVFERASSNKLEMIAAQIDHGRSVPIHERQLSTKPPSLNTLRYARDVEVGITWGDDCRCDMDIYVQPASGDQPLYFANRRTDEGVFHRDFRSGRDLLNGLEYVTLDVPVNLKDMLIGVNFYSGQAPEGVTGEIRVSIGPRTYAMPFKISGTSGTGSTGRNAVLQTRKSPNDRWFVTTGNKVVETR